MSSAPPHKPVPLLVPGALALIAGLWSGLVRLGVALPPSAIPPAEHHGALMAAGFLGTLIGLERAVALSAIARQHWAYAAPLANGLGALALIAGLPGPLAPALLVLGAAALVAASAFVVRARPDAPHGVMAAGALLLLGGDVALLAGVGPASAAPWWVAFLVLTVAGERLELAHLAAGRRIPAGFAAGAALLALGGPIALASPAMGVRAAGAGLVLLAAWFLRHDLARRTIRAHGLPRFIAACLLAGYAWLLAAGVMWLAFAGDYGGGARHDAMLHAVMLGFVFSMIFGHAPIILPAVTGAPLVFRARFYAHLALLHGSVLARVAGDLAGHATLRQVGGVLNAAAILLFIASTALAVLQTRRVPGSVSPVRSGP